MAYNRDIDAQTNLSDEHVTALEAMIDSASVTDVLYAMAAICRCKADHLRTNWQDNASAKCWERDASQLDKLPTKLS